MGVAWARVGLLLLLLAAAVPTATVLAQQGGEEGPVPERQTSCWPCHAPWSPPLQSFYNVLPPPEAGAAVGEPFDYVVQIQGAWTPSSSQRDLAMVYYEPTLDLTAAPSLGFVADTPPHHDEQAGAVSLDPADPTAPQSAFIVSQIPIGATELTATLTPSDPSTLSGADFTFNVYPGVSEPTGAPAFTVDMAGRGGAETVSLMGAEAFKGLGYGNWTFEGVWTPVDPAADPASLIGLPSPQERAFTVVVDALVKDTGERAQSQPTRVTVAEGGSALAKFRLRSSGPPAAGEVVRVVVNATMYYRHDNAANDNYANVTKPYAADIPVAFEDPRAVVRTAVDPSTVVAGGGIQNGATLDTISEAVGYGAGMLLLSSIWTGGMFGKASRRSLNGVFGTAKRRVAFHNFLSYGLMLFAAVHTVLFIVEAAYHWTLGLIWGGIALLSMLLLGVTGAFQVQMIRGFSYNAWRWTHYGLAVAAILFTLVHLALDGVHFGFVQERLGWENPLDTRPVG